MKKIFTVWLLLFVLIFNFKNYAALSTDAYDKTDIKINNRYIKFSSEPFILNSTAYIPLRSFAETIYADIEWKNDEKAAVISTENQKIEFYPNKKNALLNEKTVYMSEKALIYNDRLYVPVRFLADSLGGETNWDSFYRNVCLSFENIEISASAINYDYTDDDVFWLGRIIEAESSGEPFSGKLAVGSVVLNRVESEIFPNTIYGVIFDRNYGIQFQPIINGTIYNTPSTDSISAAKYALKGVKPVGDCLYFLNPKTAQSHWIINNRTYYSTIKNHDFYL